MHKNVLTAHADGWDEAASAYEHDGASGMNEIGFLLRRAALKARAIAAGTPLPEPRTGVLERSEIEADADEQETAQSAED